MYIGIGIWVMRMTANEKTQQDAWFAPPPTSGAVADASLGGVALRVAAGMVGASMGVVVAPAPAPPTDTEAAKAGSGTSTPNANQSEFRIFWYHAPHLVPFEAAVRALNPAGAVLPILPPIPQSRRRDVHPSARPARGPPGRAEKGQCGAFICAPLSLVLWAPQVESLIPLAAEFEEKLFKYIWRTRGAALPSAGAPVRESLAAPAVLGSLLGLSLIIGPVAQYHQNSAFYSAVKPAPNPAVDNALPHITIQCPVYKENLKETIAPSAPAVKKAMWTCARQDGTSAIFICDDGMQLISEEDRQERMAFYANHNIGWTARPGHGRDGFVRKGKFKKPSNMNYGLALSLKLEKHLAALEAAGVSEDDGECLEDKAMHLAVEEIYEDSGRKYRPWACNRKSLRVGEIILIIDSDTIVPEDCFRDAAREMYESPDLAIIQHESDVMQVAHHYFENGITHFTPRINKCISYGYGEVVRSRTSSRDGKNCDEIVFNPLVRWWRSGPISQRLRGFVWSIAPVHYKIGMMSYMFLYYGMAAATITSTIFRSGLAPELDRFYLKSFKILLTCTVVFPGLGNLGFTLLEYRLGHRNFFSALFENLRWVPFFLFFGDLSTAILAHLFSYDTSFIFHSHHPHNAAQDLVINGERGRAVHILT
ncbi:hypothetical protein B0H16DRAFT_1769098 [Mycena metata]|uniref:Glycosyltransferase 2-like domain-containing protein n=1 Tax=Mycena metata TaxID=1033252 RepID=A0AAD7JWZ1_9AGAR|nr:hypothetical protein B0H16DRAFT_1769098 [Mycena metata]